MWRGQGAESEFDQNIRETILELYRSRWDEVKTLFDHTLDINQIKTNRLIRNIWGGSYKVAQRQLVDKI